MRYLLFFPILLLTFTLKGQYEYHMTQYMIHQPFINPAATGPAQDINAALFYRMQWVGFNGAPQVGGVNANIPINPSNNVGLTILNDRIGVNNNTQIAANYAYTIKIDEESNLSFGTAVSVNMNQSKFEDVNTTVVDPVYSSNTPVLTMPNFKFGTYYWRKNFYIGVAVPNILHNEIIQSGGYESNTTFDFKRMHLFLHSGYKYKINREWSLNGSLLFKQIYGSPFQVDVNIFGNYKNRFGLGLGYRSSQDLAILLQFGLNEQFKLIYSYDITLSGIRTYSAGSHEVMIVFDYLKEGHTRVNSMPRF